MYMMWHDMIAYNIVQCKTISLSAPPPAIPNDSGSNRWPQNGEDEMRKERVFA